MNPKGLILFLFLSTTLFFFACNSGEETVQIEIEPIGGNYSYEEPVKYDRPVAPAIEEVLPPVDVSKIEASYEKGREILEENLVRGNAKFAFDMYQALFDAENNLVYSPYSISYAMAMTYGGAVGKTEIEIKSSMNFPSLNHLGFHQAFYDLNQKIKDNAAGAYTLNTANKIWKLPSFPVEDGFANLAVQYYKSPIDFFNNAADGASKINNWAAQQTNDKIKEVVTPSDLLNTRMALVNAIYFFGNWETEFPEENTEKSTFYAPESDVEVDFMREKMKTNILAKMDDYTVLELYYKDRKASMLIVLPDEGKALKDIKLEMNANNYLRWIDQMRQTDIVVRMPKFKLEPPMIPLKDLLVEKFDMRLSFRADGEYPTLTKMTSLKDIHLQNVFHKAFIEVNEKGTEAAAVTVVTTGGRGIAQTGFININRPFLYLIKENSTNSILFMGQVTNPAN